MAKSFLIQGQYFQFPGVETEEQLIKWLKSQPGVKTASIMDIMSGPGGHVDDFVASRQPTTPAPSGDGDTSSSSADEWESLTGLK